MTYDREDIPGTADEYVLGLLDPREAAEVEVEMERDADLKAAIAASRERFLPLDTSIEPAAISEGLWRRIEAALPAQSQSIEKRPQTRPSNDNRRGWRMTALLAIAATIALAIGLAASLMRIQEPLVVAVLLNDAGEVQAVVEDFGSEKAVVRMLADFDVPSDKTIQVWTLPSREMGPVSLGLIDGIHSATLDGPVLPTPQSDQLYEITLEQAGGSPTGLPTGPILAKGFAKLPR